MAETAIDLESKRHYLESLGQARWKRGSRTFNDIRRTNEERFIAMGFPHRKEEAWRRTNINPIVKTPFRSLIEPNECAVTLDDVAPYLYREQGWDELVFVDGFLRAELSDGVDRVDGVDGSDGSGRSARPWVGSLAEALRAENPVVAKHLGHYVSANGTGGNAFVALNSAFLLDGAFVYVPKGTCLERPIHLVFVTSEEAEGSAVHPRNLVVVDDFAELTIVESYVTLAGTATYFTNAVTEVSVGAGANVRWYKVQSEGGKAYHLATTNVLQQRGSSFDSWVIASGGAISRNQSAVTLEGEGASCTMRKLSMAEGDQLIDNAASIDHAAAQCSSWIGAKTILDGNSAGVFSGRILVQRGAQKTDSKQLNNTLLLSEKATIDTKPILEIFADDVKCTHGATVGRAPDEVLFYFRSRGIDEAQARAMLTCGFAEDVIDTIENVPLRERLKRMVFERYSPSGKRKKSNGSI